MKIRAALIVIISICLMGSKCSEVFKSDPSDSSSQRPSSTVSLSRDNSVACGCAKGAMYAVNNDANQTKRVTVRSRAEENNGASKVFTVTVPNKGKTLLGCTHKTPRNSTPGSVACHINVSYSIEKVEIAQLFSVNQLQLASSDTVGAQGIKFTHNNCIRECLTPSHPDNEGSCLALRTNKQSKSNDLDKVTTFLATRIGATISKAEVLKEFDIKEDPCNRTDLVLASGIFKNEGEACAIDTLVSNKELLDSGVRLSIPSTWEGTLQTGTDWTTITFSDLSKAASITFTGNEDRTRDFGGVVTKLFYNDDAMIAETENGCLGALSNPTIR